MRISSAASLRLLNETALHSPVRKEVESSYKNMKKKKTGAPTQYSLFDKAFGSQPLGSQTPKRHHLSLVRKRPEKPKLSLCYLTTVRQNGMKLAEVPDDCKTPEICLAAVQNNRLAYQFVPEKFKSIEICVASLPLAWFDLPEPYRHIPEKIQRTSEFWDIAMQRLYLDAVKVSGRKLELIPEERKTPKVCLIAVRRWGRALQFVPAKLKTPELCLAAVRQDVRAIKYVPKRYLFRLYSSGAFQNSNVPAIAELQKIAKYNLSLLDLNETDSTMNTGLVTPLPHKASVISFPQRTKFPV